MRMLLFVSFSCCIGFNIIIRDVASLRSMSAVILHAVSMFFVISSFQIRVGVFVVFRWCLMAPVGFFVVFGLCLMAPKAKLTAALFQERYGALVSSEHGLCDCETAAY